MPVKVVLHVVDAVENQSVALLRRTLLKCSVVFDLGAMAVMPPHWHQVHVFFGGHREFMLVFLGDVIEIDVSDRIIVAECHMQVKVISAIEVNPLLTVWVMMRHRVRL